VASSKTAIDKPIRDHLRAIKAIPKILEANARESIERFDSLKATVLAPLEAAQSSQDAILAMLAGIPTRCMLEFNTSDSVRVQLHEIEEQFDLADFWPELTKKAKAAYETATTVLRDTLERLEREEATAAELARLQAEAAIREQQERDRLIREEAARKAREEEEARARRDREDAERRAAEARQREEQAKLDAKMAEQRAIEAEQLRQADAEAAEQRRIADEQAAAERQRLAVEQAEQAERDRIAEEERQAEIARKAREDDKAHRTTINRAALNALMTETGIDIEMGKAVLTAIGTGLVPNVRIHY
jgi:phage-related minor tail protein